MIQAGIRRFYKPFIALAIGANAVGTVVIFAMIAIMNTDVIARGVFVAPLRGVVEMVIFSLVLIVFLQLPDVVRNNRLTRSDGFLVTLQGRFPILGDGLGRLIDAAACVFFALITWTMWPEFLESIETCHFITPPEFGPAPSGDFFADVKAAFARCEYFGTPGIFTAPWWPAKLAIVSSAALCTIIFAFKVLLGNRNPVLVDPPHLSAHNESPV